MSWSKAMMGPVLCVVWTPPVGAYAPKVPPLETQALPPGCVSVIVSRWKLEVGMSLASVSGTLIGWTRSTSVAAAGNVSACVVVDPRALIVAVSPFGYSAPGVQDDGVAEQEVLDALA
jgi:hypothetical protein